MYNPYQAPGQYGAPGGFAGYPGAPPGMGPPPGMAAPGTSVPPGMQPQEAQQDGRPTGFPPNFQPPANMPNINFSAPVIRLGTSQPARSDLAGGREDRGGRRAGLGSGMDRDGRGQDRGALQQIQPQSKEEIIKTIFVGGITEGTGGDEGIERILQSAGSLRRWIRAIDAEEKPCKFGFAEYEDPEILNTAIQVLKDVQVPVKRQVPPEAKPEEDEAEEQEIDMSTLLIIADENSHTYLDQYFESIGGIDTATADLRLEHARSQLKSVLHDLAHPPAATHLDPVSHTDRDGDTSMINGTTSFDVNGEILTIPISADDELSDIPAEMRETVAKEIAAFRDRSIRRDLERLKREEEIEQQERSRMLNGSGSARANRLASPPPSAPSGPAGGANGIPVGPRDRSGTLNAPSGPKALTSGGVQIPRDYAKGVSFVNGNGVSSTSIILDAKSAFDETDTDASDSELEQRRKSKVNADQEKAFLDQERRWLNRERSRTAAVEREKARDADEEERREAEREAMRRRLKEWDDVVESERKSEEYYVDRSAWIRNRAGFRTREMQNDDMDRRMEMREQGREDRNARAEGQADEFSRRELLHPDRVVDQVKQENDNDNQQERETRREPAKFKLSLGAAAQRLQTTRDEKQMKHKRTVAEVEGLLEDEDEEPSQPRALIPITYDASTGGPGADLTEEERAQAAKQLAGEIPSDKEGLWKWPVKWEFVDESVIEERLKPFVEKKIVEYLGVQEDMVVDVVVSGVRGRKTAGDVVGSLVGALDEEEAEALVKKLWRMVIFFSESEKRGLSA